MSHTYKMSHHAKLPVFGSEFTIFEAHSENIIGSPDFHDQNLWPITYGP